MRRKKVLLGSLKYWNIDILIKQELENMGYEVVLMPYSYYDNPFSTLEKGEILLHELFGNKNIRNKRTKQRILKMQEKAMSKYDHYDVCLVVRADFYSCEILEKMKYRSNKMIGYHCDSVDKFPVFEKINKFDDFYVYDNNDIINYPALRLKKTTNFYFKKKLNQDVSYDYDFYYLGHYEKKRVDTINQLVGIFEENDVSYKFDIVFDEVDVKLDESMNLTPLCKTIPYDEYLLRMEKSKYVLDMMAMGNSGISFRIIESLYYKKKVVTNNINVKEYDFYCPENIFILDERPLSELKCFLQSGYKELDPTIVEKYSFEHWFNEKIKQVH